MKKALVVLSGGLDSTTVLAQCIRDFGKENVGVISFFYGQRHSKEIYSVQEICRHYSIDYNTYDISSIYHGSKNVLLDKESELPEGSYESQGDAPATEVPFRNGIFLSIAASMAMEKGFDYVYCGIHQDDAGAAYADTSEAFFDGMRLAAAAGTHNKVSLRAPFLTLKKVDVVRKGLELNAPFHLTWSCYNGGEKPCGKCATCIQRAKAFEEADAKDPLISE